ncbi:MAG TPA: S8 family serine peptidase [Dokdonella sp.]
MRQFVRVNALASAVGLALIGVAFDPPAGAAQITAASTQQADSRAEYIITFVEPGLLNYQGGTQGLAATAPRPDAASRKLDVRSAAAVAYQGYLESARSTHLADVEGALGRSLAVTHSYAITQNGVAAELTADEAARVANVPGVASVKLAGVEQLVTFRGPKFIGAGSIWSGAATPTHVGTYGQGVVFGDLDGGTNSDHPSFANDPTCGFSEANPKLIAVDCSTTSSSGACNGSNPEANPGFGHGVHTSSTVAGNVIDNTVTPPPALPDGITMSGVAPCASIRHYKVCATNTCAGSAILAGINNAIADQVDVINFSISGGTTPWSDNDRNFLDAVHADIFVAAAAGNLQSGETDPTSEVNHLGPWVTTVAASTQDQILSPVLSAVGPGTPPAEITAIPMIPGSTTTTVPAYDSEPIKSYPTNLIGCTANGGIPAGTFTGSIALLQRGTCTFTEKITNAFNAGAVMVVIANNQAGQINMDTTGAPDVPAFSIDQAPGNALIAFVGANEGTAVADTVPSGIGAIQGDVLASFSYRGPTTGSYKNETKPDISAPGVNIYAALDDTDGNYGLMSGTSMATPHTTGSGALLRAVHPEWTPIEIKSALQTTATNADGVKEDGVTPWSIDDVGSGRVDLTKAALVGLTLDETYANFLAANPSGGSIAIQDLNLPSLRNVSCSPNCTWTRTVKSQLTTSGSWSTTFTPTIGDASVSVSPASFTLAPGATQTLTITATPGSDASAIAFGNLVLTEANGQSPDQHITVAVKGVGGPPPSDNLCNNGACVLKIDNYEATDANVNALGAGPGTSFVYLNRFTPDATDFPFTLTEVQTLFVGLLSDGTPGAVVGEPFDVYIYQDDDNDPSNGATLVAAVHDVPVASPLGTMQTIELPNGGVELTGGDVLVALQYHGLLGTHPASADSSGDFQERSYIGDVHEDGADRSTRGADDEIFADGFDGGPAPPEGPDLAAEDMTLVTNVVPTFTHNFIIRASGVQPGTNRAITLSSGKSKK